MKRLLIASLFATLPACAATNAGNAREHADAVSEADSKQPDPDTCDQSRATAKAGRGEKPCVMVTGRGFVTVAFDRLGNISMMEGIDTLDGSSRRLQFDNWTDYIKNVDLVGHTTLWQTQANGATEIPTAQATDMHDSRGRNYYYVQETTFTVDLVHHVTDLTRKTPSNIDQCDVWWKSAEGSTMTALVEHSDGGSKKYQAWWDGKSTFPLHCGRFTGDADISQFKEVIDRFAPQSAQNAFLDDVSRKFGAKYEPAHQGFDGNVRTSIFDLLHKAHLAARGQHYSSAGTIMEGVDTSDPAGSFFWGLAKGVGGAIIAGAAAAGGATVASSETGPPAVLIGMTTGTVVLSGALMDLLIDQLRIREQLERDKAIEKAKKAGQGNSDNDDTDTDGDGIPDSSDPDADGDGIPDENETDFGDNLQMFADNDAHDEGEVNMDGSSDPSGGVWDDGDGSDINVDPSNPGADPWCPTADCDRDPSMPSGVAARPFRAL